EIDPQQAAIVVRIFEEYAAGVSTRAICERLMAERIMSPAGTYNWNHQKFISSGALGGKGGMLGNLLYVGKLVWNELKQVKNPENGKGSSRAGNVDDRIEVDVPHLRIISDRLFAEVQAMRASRRKAVNGPRIYRTNDRNRMMMGLLRCSLCGG